MQHLLLNQKMIFGNYFHAQAPNSPEYIFWCDKPNGQIKIPNEKRAHMLSAKHMKS